MSWNMSKKAKSNKKQQLLTYYSQLAASLRPQIISKKVNEYQL